MTERSPRLGECRSDEGDRLLDLLPHECLRETNDAITEASELAIAALQRTLQDRQHVDVASDGIDLYKTLLEA